ncbi:unnamed protein product, partial [Choristocarpus tenellus]
MESFVIGLLSKYLRQYVLGFKREQLSLSFLKGKGEMRDLEVNCEAINDLLTNVPVIRFSKIHINRLWVKVPLRQIRVEPIRLNIDEVEVEIVEPTDFVTPTHQPLSRHGATTKRSKYGVGERIRDSFSLDIDKVIVTFRVLGKRKCPLPGPWTPPAARGVIKGLRFFSTDEHGEECSLEQCWRYSKEHMGTTQDIFIFKKATCQSCHFFLVEDQDPFKKGQVEVVKAVPVDLLLTVRRRSLDNFLKGMQIEISLDRVDFELHVSDGSLSALMHFVVGFGYCLFRQGVSAEMLRDRTRIAKSNSTTKADPRET